MVFALYVAETVGMPQVVRKKPFLNANPVQIPGLKDWRFGVARRYVSVQELEATLKKFEDSGVWQNGADTLKTGALATNLASFCAPDGSELLKVNGLLKNNFVNGSHFIELSDQTKEGLSFLFEEPDLIEKLSQAIAPYVPLKIGGLPDRVGNIVIQFPVTSIVARFGGMRVRDALCVEVAWHTEIEERPLTASYEVNFDGVISSYGSTSLASGSNDVVVDRTNRGFKAYVWDDTNKLLLAASATTWFIQGLGSSMSTISRRPRKFLELGSNNAGALREIAITSKSKQTEFGLRSFRPNGSWTDQRIYSDEMRSLAAGKRFVQYGATQGSEHDRALDDVRWLIRKHGEYGVYLWDPYLSARDLLETLFYCGYAEAELRALTSNKPAKNFPTDREDAPEDTRVNAWVAKQRADLIWANLEPMGLRLDFRISRGNAGFPFHDRFLIFPGQARRPALAWSLGISINQIGNEHHILQQVSNGEPVERAFLTLWDRLTEADHRIWTHP